MGAQQQRTLTMSTAPLHEKRKPLGHEKQKQGNFLPLKRKYKGKGGVERPCVGKYQLYSAQKVKTKSMNVTLITGQVVKEWIHVEKRHGSWNIFPVFFFFFFFTRRLCQSISQGPICIPSGSVGHLPLSLHTHS